MDRRHLPPRATPLALVAAVVALALPAAAEAGPPARPPLTDCVATVGYALNGPLPGYVVPGEPGPVCVPFTQVPPAPAGARGDYHVTAFSDGAARRRLAACRARPPCAAITAGERFAPQQFRATGTLAGAGSIDPHAGRVDLRQVRRPGFFGIAPYLEPIAAAEQRAYTFEYTVPAEPYERLDRAITAPVKLRGWYLTGRGIRLGSERRRRALVILAAGRSVETTAVQDPDDALYARAGAGGPFRPAAYPAGRTEQWGARQWREYLHRFNAAGFDVLSVDKRGHGVSGAISADNAFRQGLDMLAAIDALTTGAGVRTLAPDGTLRSGRRAVRKLLPRRAAARMPIILGGASQGALATEWAMHANVNRWCELDLPARPCHDPDRRRNVKGAVLLAALFGGFGDPADLAFAAAQREVNHTVYLPTSEPLAGIGRWPAVFFGKGLWDEVQGPAATFDAYRRARAAELLFVRGPHSETAHGPANVALMQDRAVRFAVRAALGRPPGAPAYADLRQAIAASPPTAEPTSASATLP